MFSTETKKMHRLFFICLSVLIGAFVLVACSYYIINKKFAVAEIKEKLMNTSILASEAVNAQLKEPMQYLTVALQAYSGTYTPEDMLLFLISRDTNQIFTDFAWIDTSGTAVTASGQHMVLETAPYLTRIFSGESRITYLRKLPGTQDAGIVYGIPVKQNGSVTGALLGIITPATATEYTLLNILQGQGYMNIIDTEGNIIVRSRDPRSILTESDVNYFEFMEKRTVPQKKFSIKAFREQILQGTQGFFYYRLPDNTERLLYYLPLDFADWYLLIILPTDSLQMEFYRIPGYFGLIGVLIISLACIITILFQNKTEQYRKSLENILYTDPITGGMSNAKFEQLARERIRKADPETYTYISLDLYGFKLINDMNGGGGGNAVLIHMYTVLQKFLEPEDIMCRVNADVFAMLVKTKSPEQMVLTLSEFAAALNGFNNSRQDKYYLRIKAGFYTIPNGWLSFMTIKDRSNIARKTAQDQKTTNLFTYEFFNDAELTRQTHERELENCMEQALRNKEFKMYLQPKINIQTGTVVGAEALVRWQSPVYGFMSPGEFIPVFEKNGFITRIDLELFEQACIFLQKQMQQDKPLIPISVNLSRIHLYNPRFLDDFIAIRKKYGIPATFLEFEITESMAFEQLKIMGTVIQKIHEAGFTCSIDDFGSGYSSLNALGDIPADVLKMDKIFFRFDPYKKIRNSRIIASVISMAKQLDMQVVAEGIETSSQAMFLQDAECDIIQGFIYSQPLPVEEFTLFMNNWSSENVVSQ